LKGWESNKIGFITNHEQQNQENVINRDFRLICYFKVLCWCRITRDAFQVLKVEQQNWIYCKSRVTKLGKRINRNFRLICNFKMICWCGVVLRDFWNLKMWEENRKWQKIETITPRSHLWIRLSALLVTISDIIKNWFIYTLCKSDLFGNNEILASDLLYQIEYIWISSFNTRNCFNDFKRCDLTSHTVSCGCNANMQSYILVRYFKSIGNFKYPLWAIR